MSKKIAKALLLAAAAAVLSSVFFPYWYLTVKAPQYPKGLHIQVYLSHVTGDIAEIDNLNHYIGMRPLGEAAKLEKKLALPGIALIVFCLTLAVFISTKFSILLILPTIVLPAIFAADLYLWLRDFGLHLNPHAALSSSIKPFVPPLLGPGKIAQFHAAANFGLGHGLSMLSMFLSLTVIIFRFFGGGASGHKKIIPAAVIIIAMDMLFPCQAFARTLTAGTSAYPTIESAVQKAADGDTVIVKKGIYSGPLVITKSIRLEGQDFPVIDGGGKGTVVTIKAPDVVLRGFVIRNSGDLLASENSGLLASGARPVIENNRFEDVLFGVYLSRAPGGVLRGNFFRGKPLDTSRRGDLIRVWFSDGVVIENNRTERGRDVVLWYSKNMTLRGNDFRYGRYGVHFMYCRHADVENNRFIGNSVGAYLMYSEGLKLRGNTVSNNRGPSGFGIGFKDMKNAVIEHNVVTSNRVGLYLDGCETMLCRRNIIAHNDIGFNLMPTAVRNRFEGNNVIDNAEQTLIDGASIQTVNNWGGNYWSDYRGFDSDRDGTGDVPYRPMRLFERLTDRFHDLRIFFGSPSVQAIDFAAVTFPVFAPTPKFEDARPLMRPVNVAVRKESVPRSGLWGAVSALLFLPLAGFFKKNADLPARLAHHLSTPAMPNTQSTLIRARGVSKRYKKVQALSNVDFEVRRGEAVALWGPNGAGKTTLLRCLLGIIRFEGSAEVEGFDVKRRGRDARSLVGYVPQEIRLHQDQTVWETVSFYARLRGVPRERVEKLLNEWDLPASRHQMVQNLSGGMKQKLALIIALLSDPPLLFLDEPTSSLDARTRHEFNLVLDRLKGAGKTLVFCTHRASEVRKTADRVIVLDGGVIKAEGRPESVRPHLSRRAA
jgi:nitrous oxidase accessory protein